MQTQTKGLIHKPSQKERILQILQDREGRWVDGMVFENLQPRITQSKARLFELKEEGYEIESRFIEGKNWKEYRLKAKDTLF